MFISNFRDMLKIRFVILKQKIKNGRAPIYIQIRINGTQSYATTHIEIDVREWLSDKNSMCECMGAGHAINDKLYEFRLRIEAYYSILSVQSDSLTASMIVDCMRSKSLKIGRTYMQIADMFLRHKHAQIGIRIGLKTYKRYVTTIRYFREYLQMSTRRTDIALIALKPSVVVGFYVFLHSTKGSANNNAVKYIKQFKTIYMWARDEGWATKNPFGVLHFSIEPVSRSYLSENELRRIMNIQITDTLKAYYRDIFIFSCFTGLAYVDICNLKRSDLIYIGDKDIWLHYKRQKNNMETRLKLLPPPIGILEKHRNNSDEFLFHLPSNGEMNRCLKDIIAACNIEKNITYHSARHTFATTVTLSNGVPIETVSKMLGHTNIRTTQIYAKIVDSKIDADMKALTAKIAGKYL